MENYVTQAPIPICTRHARLLSDPTPVALRRLQPGTHTGFVELEEIARRLCRVPFGGVPVTPTEPSPKPAAGLARVFGDLSELGAGRGNLKKGKLTPTTMPPRTSSPAAARSADRASSSKRSSAQLIRTLQPTVSTYPSSIRSASRSSGLAHSDVLPLTDRPSRDPSLPNHRGAGYQEDDDEAFIEPLFQTALHIVQSSLPRSGQIQPTYNDKLLLYSLFKQAVHGDVKSSTISKRPGVFDMLGRAKWDAWKAKEGLSCTAAKRLYIESVLKILLSHRDRPEARTLIESLSGYEAHSSAANHTSDSDEDLYSEQKIDLPSSTRGTEENTQTLQLGPYKSSSQLPDPINSSGRQILPPHSPEVMETTSESSSEPDSQSSSTEDDSSAPPGSHEVESTHVDQPNISEPRFTYAQVQRLVDQTPQTLNSQSFRSPLSNSVQPTDLARLALPEHPHEPSSPSMELLHSNIQKLNQTIDCLQILISKIELHAQPSSGPSPQDNNNNNSNSLTQRLFSPSSLHSAITLTSFLSRTRLRAWARNVWVKRFLCDISLLFLLLKVWKFLTKRPAHRISS
ncbi:hypothetical protein PCANC_06245 [Puccinia coronata f. sp. avenae]|uniref:ACB domain-containing protein n=1 Tax=Puccinia coronata f. sp. avenae TaxID=200324 RepID=A0A2N5V378_9BASI|nr:hypothetical protein PCANC_06245 [Puccinia coronata f. sp. avenae]